MNKVVKYVVYDIIRNRFVIAYTVLLLLISISFFGFGGDPAKGLLSLLNIVLLVVPLVSVIFTTVQFYNSYEFLELLLAQPVSRKSIFYSQFLGISTCLSLAFLAGVGLPVLFFEGSVNGLILLFCGLMLTLSFVSLAFFTSVLTNDKAKGIGITLGIWFYFSLIYDGLVLSLLLSFADYPLEKVCIFLTMLNPIDLARVIVLMKLDISALMGITGAVFQKFFNSDTGMGIAGILLLFWVIMPVKIAFRIFNRKDL